MDKYDETAKLRNTMSKRALAALKKSIKHWETNVQAKTPYEASVSGLDCALCRLYSSTCGSCPVYLSTGNMDCVGSPYPVAARRLTAWGMHWDAAALDDWRKAAKAELDFLKSLLPEDSK